MNDIELSDNAKRIFENLYCLQGESIDESFKRVANEYGEDEELAYELLKGSIWRPNTPVWLNAGSKHRIYSACFVAGLDDSMDGIYDIANVARKIFQFGSGIGIPIGNLRERNADIFEGDIESTPEGKSSGPVTFMKLYDAVGESTKSGGRVRRAAILCTMPVWHPDVMEFIKCKENDGRLANMNISVAITDNYMKSLEDDITFNLYSPQDCKNVGNMRAEELWDSLSYMAWKTADPGVLFIDTINKYNVLKKRFLIECPNPCGEQVLTPFSCCNLSAINVHKFVKDGEMDWDTLYDTAYKVMRLMDNLIDRMEFPDDRFKDNALKYRHVGIGPMGLSDAMFELGIKYDGPFGKKFAGDVMRTITTACVECSADLANEKGKFHDYEFFKDDVEEIINELVEGNEKVMKKVRKFGLRNTQHSTAQPTGTTALSCDTSYGIEPCFGLVFQKNLIDGTTMMVANPIFSKKYKGEEWYTDDLVERIFNNGGTLKNLRGIPKEVREVFITAHDIKPKDRIDIQASMQKYCSTSISSTVNLPETSTKEDVSEIYKYAYKSGLKGVTVYRDGCKDNQPVTFKPKEEKTNTLSIDFERPSRLSADVYKLDTGRGTMYVTVGLSDGRPVELFVQLGKGGQYLNTLTEGIGRVVSVALQHGVPIDSIVKTLIGINSDNPTWCRLSDTDTKPVQVLSVPDGLAKLLDRFYSNGDFKEFKGETCPQCSKPLSAIEGCMSCTYCGYSKCS